MAARSHNYAATMHISLSMAAKQGLETYLEKASVLQAASPRRAEPLLRYHDRAAR
jgi:hypothetical protein